MEEYYTSEEGFFRGPEGFLERELRIGQIIRVYDYGRIAPDEEHYIVGEDKTLYNVKDFKNPVDVLDVLSDEAAPNGWTFEGLELSFFPEEIIRQYLKRGLLNF